MGDKNFRNKLINNSITHSPSEDLILAQPFWMFSTFYRIGRFITGFTKAH
jgi:hypothetical protein